MTLWTWSKVGRRIALAANVPQFSTHTTRHLCLTDLARMGWELHAIATFAGHRLTESTMCYIHLSGRELSDKLNRATAVLRAERIGTLTRPPPLAPGSSGHRRDRSWRRRGGDGPDCVHVRVAPTATTAARSCKAGSGHAARARPGVLRRSRARGAAQRDVLWDRLALGRAARRCTRAAHYPAHARYRRASAHVAGLVRALRRVRSRLLGLAER